MLLVFFEPHTAIPTSFFLFPIYREDYDRLSQFVSEKNLRVRNKGKVPDHALTFRDDASSDSDHDAYLERMKAEGEDKDSEDGIFII